MIIKIIILPNNKIKYLLNKNEYLITRIYRQAFTQIPITTVMCRNIFTL